MKKLMYVAMAAMLVLPLAAFAGVCLNCDPPVEVPEPSTFALMAISLAAAAVIKYKNRNK